MHETTGLIQPYTDRDTTALPLPSFSTIPLPSRDAIQICPLGGVSDIGMNWTLYGFGGRYVLVDAGSGFAPRDVDGVEAIFPDPKVLKSLGDRLAALVVTHFHEDHVGAIHRVWPMFAKCPIYAPPFAAGMLTNRFREKNLLKDVVIKTFNVGASLRVGPFHVQTIPVAHSTPDCVALAIRAPTATVLHTGDWKVDDTPGVGHSTDFRRFRKLGDSGVDLMLCDSTNADRNSPASTEASVERALTKIFNRTKGMVVVSSFGSNVARMASVGKASAMSNRKVALAGRSLRNAEEVAFNLGLMKGIPKFLKETTEFKGMDRRNQTLMCTGTQGEENASLAKLAARSSWRLPHVQSGDVIVHSARAIPGNEDYIFAILDKLRDQGAEIVTADFRVDGDPIHVTGHPCVPDLIRMYEAVRPRIAMPVHGSPSHLAAHAEVARGQGVAKVVTPLQGHVYELANDELRCVGRVTNGYVGVLGDSAGTIVGWDEEASRPAAKDAARVAAFLATTPSDRGNGRQRDGARPAQGRGERDIDRPVRVGSQERPARAKVAKGRDVKAGDASRVPSAHAGGRHGRVSPRVDVANAHRPSNATTQVARREDETARLAKDMGRPANAPKPGRSLALDLDFIKSFGGHATPPDNGEGSGRDLRGRSHER